MLHFHGMHDDGLATRLAMHLLHCTSYIAPLTLHLLSMWSCSTKTSSQYAAQLPHSASTIVRLAHTAYTVHNTCEECVHNVNKKGQSKALLNLTYQCDCTWLCFKFFYTFAMYSSNKNLYRLLCVWGKGKEVFFWDKIQGLPRCCIALCHEDRAEAYPLNITWYSTGWHAHDVHKLTLRCVSSCIATSVGHRAILWTRL